MATGARSVVCRKRVHRNRVRHRADDERDLSALLKVDGVEVTVYSVLSTYAVTVPEKPATLLELNGCPQIAKN